MPRQLGLPPLPVQRVASRNAISKLRPRRACARRQFGGVILGIAVIFGSAEIVSMLTEA